MNTRDLIDKMNHDRQREAKPNAVTMILAIITTAAAIYFVLALLFTA
jgi:hypothetical protein